MNAQQHNNMMRVLLALTALLFVSCATASGFISEQQARDTALKSSDQSHLRMLEPPSNVRAELLTLETARKQLAQTSDPAGGYAPGTMVWLVTMKGTWMISGGPPTPQGASQAPQEAFHSFAIIIDAKTGDSINETASR